MNDDMKIPGTNFFAMLSFTAGKAHRHRDTFSACHLIVIDDVQEHRLKLPLPYMLETAPGVHRGCYILDPPETDRAKVEPLLEHLVHSGATTNAVAYGLGPEHEEKAPQISAPEMTAFGIHLSTRYSKACEMAEMLRFAELVSGAGLEGMVREVFYDSKADICTFIFNPSLRAGSNASGTIYNAAKEAISQFDWYDMIEHGAQLRPGRPGFVWRRTPSARSITTLEVEALLRRPA